MGQRMINIPSARPPLQTSHVFHNGVWRFFGIVKHLVVYYIAILFSQLFQASQQTVKAVELPSCSPFPTVTTRFYASTSVGDDVTKLLERLLVNCLDYFLASC